MMLLCFPLFFVHCAIIVDKVACSQVHIFTVQCVGNMALNRAPQWLWKIFFIAGMLLASAVSGTPCPLSGSGTLALVNGSSYDFTNCPAPVNATGTDVRDVSMKFRNAAPGHITLTGATTTGFKLVVSNATVISPKLLVSASVVTGLEMIYETSQIDNNQDLIEFTSSAVVIADARMNLLGCIVNNVHNLITFSSSKSVR